MHGERRFGQDVVEQYMPFNDGKHVLVVTAFAPELLLDGGKVVFELSAVLCIERGVEEHFN
ncbi:hypothetical protein D3C84_799180 [compost metagenome]